MANISPPARARKHATPEFVKINAYSFNDYFHQIQQMQELARLQGRKLRAVLYMRVSTRKQNLKNRLNWLSAECGRLGIKTASADPFTDEASGKKQNRQGLIDAIEYAMQLQTDHPDELVVILTDCRNRFLRAPGGKNSHTDWFTEMPGTASMYDLMKMADGIPLCTTLSPSATAHEVRSHENTISSNNGHPRGTRNRIPRKRITKAMKDERLPKVLEKLGEKWSKHQIAEYLGISRSTVINWTRGH